VAHNHDRAATRHGTENGSITLGGRRVPVRRPRVRTVADDDHSAREVPLETYTTLAATDLLAEGIVARMLAGISTRRYPVALEPVGDQVDQDAQATSKSAVSRRFVAATAERLAELHARPLGDQRWLIVYLDGFGFGEHTLVGALGVTLDGAKVPLGVVEGSTENAAVCTRLVSDLAACGLDATRGILFVVDGGKAIAKAVDDVFGDLALTQRCRRHKERKSSTTSPSTSGRWCAARCAPPGLNPLSLKPQLTSSRSRAAWRASGPAPPRACAKALRRR